MMKLPMKIETQIGPTPDVSCVQVFPHSQQNEVNDRLARQGWILLGILVTREVSEDGSFCDFESYVIGMKRPSGQ
jgi:hypothetical protein